MADEMDSDVLGLNSISEDLLSVDDLSVFYGAAQAGRTSSEVCAVRSASIRVGRGQCVGVVGESGSGKSTLARSCLGLVSMDGLARVEARRLSVCGRDMAHAGPRSWRLLLRSDVGFVGQSPLDALNPVTRIDAQLRECFESKGRDRDTDYMAGLLASVQLPDWVGQAFPYQLSGGMRQRVVIAMALAKKPSLLIADEPTTALDATTQAEILGLIATMRREMSMGVLFISHDIDVITNICDYVYVMLNGEIVEEGPVSQVTENPQHWYTRGLIRCSHMDRRADGSLYEIEKA